MSVDGLIDPDTEYKWEDKVVGMFYIKPNYPGRCSHVSFLDLSTAQHAKLFCIDL